MAEPLRVVVLASKLPEDIWLINTLADVCRIEGIVFPAGVRYREYGVVYVLKKRLPRFGIVAVADQALLVLYRLLAESRKDRRAARTIFCSKPTDHLVANGFDIIEVQDASSDQVRDFIRAKAPQLVVVSSAPLLKQRIIEAADGRIVNVHPGYATAYRGRYGCFWPIYNHEPEMIGTTIHFVDRGIDTGRILLQEKLDVDPSETIGTITYRQHKLGGELLVRCLQDFEYFAARAYHKAGCVSRNYLAPGLTHYLKARRWLKKTASRGEAAPGRETV